MRSSESGLGCSIRTSNCLASSPKRMGVSFTGFAMFHLAFVQGYNVPFRKHVYLTKNLLLKSNGRASLRPLLPRASPAASASGSTTRYIHPRFSPKFGLRSQSSAAVQPIMAHSNKIVLVLDGQAEANVAARFFVSREDEVRGRAARRKTCTYTHNQARRRIKNA